MVMGLLDNTFKRDKNSSQNVSGNNLTNSTVNQIDAKIEFNYQGTQIDPDLLQQLELDGQSKQLLNELIVEKLNNCSKLILGGDCKKAKVIIDTLLEYGLTSFSNSNKNQFYFLKSILHLAENNTEKLNRSLSLIDDATFVEEKNLIQCLIGNQSNSIVNQKNYQLITNAYIINLNNQQEFKKISEFFNINENDTDTIDFYYGIAHFNIQNFDIAITSLQNAIKKKSDDKYYFFLYLSEANSFLINMKISNLDKEILTRLISNLNEYGDNCPEIKNSNITLYNCTKLWLIAMADNELFIEEYNKLSSEEKIAQKNILAFHYINTKDYNKALPIYSELFKDSPNEQNLILYLRCLLFNEKYSEIIALKDEVFKYSSYFLMVFYLIALRENQLSCFGSEFDLFFKKYSKDIKSLVYFLDVANTEDLNRKIYEQLLTLKEDINTVENYAKIILAIFCAEQNDIELSNQILSTVNLELNELNDEDLKEIANKLSRLKSFDSKEYFCDWFIEKGLADYNIFNLRAFCYLQKTKYKSAIEDYKKSYKLRQSNQMALSIINTDTFIPNTELLSISEYIDDVKGCNHPADLLILAQSYIKHKEFELAKDYLFKSIYMLKGKDDIDVYKGFLKVYFQIFTNSGEKDINIDKVENDIVISLQKKNEEDTIYYCCNKDELLNIGETYIGVKHISKLHPIYLKLLNKKVNDTVVLENVAYSITSLTYKHVYTYQYVMNYFYSNQLENELPFQTISAETLEGLKSEMKKIMVLAIEEQHKALNMYLDGMGNFPIETINHDEYRKYSYIVSSLLYEENNFLYSGVDRLEADRSKFVLTLSTLVICEIIKFDIAEFKKLDIEFLIPKSLLDLLCLLSTDSITSKAEGSMVLNATGEVALIPPDEKISDFWSNIYSKVYDLETEEIDNITRVNFNNKVKEKLDLEEIFHKFSIDNAQLDCLILAEKTNSIFVSDDLFFRNLAIILEIDNTNHTYFYNFTENENNLLLNLSKTNYLFIPIYPVCKKMPVRYKMIDSEKIEIDGDIILEIWKNTIHDKRKVAHYFSLFPEDMKEKFLSLLEQNQYESK